MKTLANISLVALVSLTLAGCAANASDESSAAAEEKDGPAGTAQSALVGTGLTLYRAEAYVGLSKTLTDSIADLADWDNTTNSLKNDSDQFFTVFSGADFMGRCQVILPFTSMPELATVDIGPMRISSVRLGSACTGGTEKLNMTNTSFAHDLRFRTEQNGLDGYWTGSVGAEGGTATLKFSRNAWKLNYGVEAAPEYTSNWGHYASMFVKMVDEGFIGEQSEVYYYW